MSTFYTSAFDHQDIKVSLNTNPVITKAYNLIKGGGGGGHQTLIIPSDPTIMYLLSVH